MMTFERIKPKIERIPHYRNSFNNINNLNNNNKLLEKFPENYKNCRFILLDTETTGLDISRDKLISINAVEMINSELTGIQFNAYLHKRFNKSTKPLMYYLSEYNYSREDNIKKSLETFLSFVSDSIIITHNALFDMKFINEELKRCSLPEIPLGQCICTLKILKNLKKIGRLDKNFKLRLCDLCRYYDIHVNPKDLHQGIVDAIVFARVVSKMIEDGIYNDYDNYDYEDVDSYVNCTHSDHSYDFGNSNDEKYSNINMEEKDPDIGNESINKRIKSKSEEKKIRYKNKYNRSFNYKKKKSKKINYFKYDKKNYKKNNFIRYKNNIKKGNEENIYLYLKDKKNKINKYNNNNIINNDKKKLFESFVCSNKKKDIFRKDNKLLFSTNVFDNNIKDNIEIDKEQKINFLKNAFKSYIKENKIIFKK